MPSSPAAPALGLKYTILKWVDDQRVEVSPKTVFHAGDRVQFCVEPNLERLMFSLKGAAQPASAPQDKPALEGKPKTLIAGLTIENSTIGHLREAYGRDLIIERVGDEDTPGPHKEKAVYVVNPTGSSDSRVVADIEMAHR
jgi:hypothetical protein